MTTKDLFMTMAHPRRLLGSLLCGMLIGCLVAPQVNAQTVPVDARQVEHPAIDGGQLYRLENRLFVVPDEPTGAGSVTIPRIDGSLRAAHWLGEQGDPTVSVHPEPDEWTVEWREIPAGAKAIALDFDQEPKLPTERKPVIAAGDGSLMLHAYQAQTEGEKLRYEPQPFKNTVGYWTVPTDTVSWQLRIDAPGEFNVAILQGCGAGHGGSRAAMRLQMENKTTATLAFEVLETGHFQNFQWRHLGKVSVPEPGNYTLTIMPKEIAHGALMDVRSVHLVPLPTVGKK